MSDCKPRSALQLGLNVLIESSCEGLRCRFHQFPYQFKSIVTKNINEIVEINNKKDIWTYVSVLLQEAKDLKQGGSFSELSCIWGQLPFFVCVNNIIDEESQKDISRYIYSRDTKTPPYKGSYGETPHVWIQKYYIIKNAMMLRDSKYKVKAQDGNE